MMGRIIFDYSTGKQVAEPEWDPTKESGYTPPPLPTVIDYQSAIQSLVDETARAKQFNDGVTLASYWNSTDAEWAAQAQAFTAWRDAVWKYCNAELAKVQGGVRPQPTVDEFLAELPKIVWPAPRN